MADTIKIEDIEERVVLVGVSEQDGDDADDSSLSPPLQEPPHGNPVSSQVDPQRSGALYHVLTFRAI